MRIPASVCNANRGKIEVLDDEENLLAVSPRREKLSLVVVVVSNGVWCLVLSAELGKGGASRKGRISYEHECQ